MVRMVSRPAVSAEIGREILIESGHRCVVCGVPCPLERAHIIPWHQSREHKAEDMICLCANCHERADNENWGEKGLRQYKQKPWVMRQYKRTDSTLGTMARVTLTIEELRFDETLQRILPFAIAAFLDVPPDAVQVVSVERGSVKITIELPSEDAETLLNAYKQKDPELQKYLAPLVLLDLRRELCFVIMPFRDELREVYDAAIRPAVESHGLECIRADEIPGAGNIVHDIVEYVYKAKIVIADLTGSNANVLYELGLAHSLGNNVIMLAQSIDEDVPFGLSSYRVIGYNLEFGGETRLRNNIQEAIHSFDQWTRHPSNPVQDFLSPGARPVCFSEYEEARQNLEKALQDSQSVRSQLDEYKSQESELRRLEEENARLQGGREGAETFLRRITEALDVAVDIEEVLRQSTVETDEKGEVTVSVPSSSGDREAGKRKKIIFRKVEESGDR